MKFKNYRNSHTNEDTIYSRKNIADMSVREAFSRKDEIMAQHNSIGIPSEGELKSSPNAVWVEAYTREDGTEVRGHWRSRPEGSGTTVTSNSQIKNEEIQKNKQDTITGGASEVTNEDIKNAENKKDVPKMTTSAKIQESVAKNNPFANKYPEQEYYKISLNLDKIRETGEVPEWMKEHNDVRTLDKIGNKELSENIKEKIIECAKENNDTKTLNNVNDVFVITAKPSSDLTNLVINNPKFNQEIENRISDIEDGKYEKSSFSYIFNDIDRSEKDKYKDFSTNHVISKCDVHNVKVEQNGEISATIIDYYDFSKGGGSINDNAYKQQQNRHLENYALVIPIRMKIKKKR